MKHIGSAGKRQRSKLYRKGSDNMSDVYYYKDKRYKKVDRKAKPGELILTTATRDKYWGDLVYEVYRVSPSETFVQVYEQAYRPALYIDHEDYVVLEPAED